MSHCDVIPSHAAIEEGMLRGKAAIVIDTLRATSVMVTAMEHGAASIRCVLEPAEALAMKEADPDLILCGERRALKIPGFDLSNSPLEFTREAVLGRRLVMTTTNGTRTLLKSEEAHWIHIGCLRNARAAAEQALAVGRDLMLINAGTGGFFTLDDFITAGAMISRIKGRVELSDRALAALLLYEAHPGIHSALEQSYHYRRLKNLGREADLEHCLAQDVSSVVPEYRDGTVTRPLD